MGGGFLFPVSVPGGLIRGDGIVCDRCLLCDRCCMAACAAIWDAVRLDMTLWSDIEAEGNVGSKKPWECSRLCVFPSPLDKRDDGSAEGCLAKPGLEKLLTDAILLLAFEFGCTDGRGRGGRGELCPRERLSGRDWEVAGEELDSSFSGGSATCP